MVCVIVISTSGITSELSYLDVFKDVREVLLQSLEWNNFRDVLFHRVIWRFGCVGLIHVFNDVWDTTKWGMTFLDMLLHRFQYFWLIFSLTFSSVFRMCYYKVQNDAWDIMLLQRVDWRFGVLFINVFNDVLECYLLMFSMTFWGVIY